MRETALVIPVRNGEAAIGAALERALLQTVNPYRIVVADGGSTDSTLSVAQAIANRANSAGLTWFRFDIVSGDGIPDALDVAIRGLRSDGVVLVDLATHLAPDWVGGASVALYSLPRGTVLHGSSAVAFRRSDWETLRNSVQEGKPYEVLASALRPKKFAMGELQGTYMLG